MLKGLKWLGLSLAGLVGVVLLLYVISRLLPIPEEEARALAILDAPRQMEGRNGYAALWAIRHDVPVDELEPRLAEAVRDFSAQPAWDGIGEWPAEPTLLDQYPVLDSEVPPDASLCSAQESGCLQKLRASLAVIGPVVESRAALSERVAALDGYDYFLSPFPPRFDTPFPAYQVLTRDLTSHAYAFVQGDVDAALAGVCRSASIGRKLVASGDNLIGSMIGIALMKGAGALFVDMLRELPADHPVPDQCRRVFKPDGAMQAGVCPVMKGEARYSTGSLRAFEGNARLRVFTGSHSEVKSWYAGPMFFDTEKTVARSAPRFTWFCEPGAEQLLARDLPLVQPRPPSPLSFACISNAGGCGLQSMSAPELVQYALRLQDAEARQKLVGTWMWLRDQAASSAPLQEQLASRPASLKSPSREVHVVECGKALQVRMYETGHGETWELPLPQWMRGPVAEG